MDADVGDKVRELLRRAGVDYREVHHPPIRSAEDAARARGEALRIGGKAIVVKSPRGYALFVLSAARRLDSVRLRRVLGVTRLRFATPEELAELTGLVPGTVPPFGEPILPLPLYADPSVLENDRIAFTAGSLTVSIILRVADWQRLARPRVVPFTRGRKT